MKRITVQVTLADDYYGASKRVKRAMVTAAVAKATDEDAEIVAIDTRIGHVQAVKR